MKRHANVGISVSKHGLLKRSERIITNKTYTILCRSELCQYKLKWISTHLFEIDQTLHRRETVTFKESLNLFSEKISTDHLVASIVSRKSAQIKVGTRFETEMPTLACLFIFRKKNVFALISVFLGCPIRSIRGGCSPASMARI